MTLLCAAEEDVVGAAFAALPDQALERFPYLLGVAGLHRRTAGDVAGALQLTARAAEAVQQLQQPCPGVSSSSLDALRTDALMLRLWQSRFGWLDAAAALASAREALAELEGHTESLDGRQPAVDACRVVWLTVEMAAAEIRVGDLVAASLHINGAIVGARVIGHDRLLSAALSHRAIIEMVRGQAQTSALTADQRHSSMRPGPACSETRSSIAPGSRTVGRPSYASIWTRLPTDSAS